MKLTAEEIKYYKKGADGVKLSDADYDILDTDRMTSISNKAAGDVRNKREKRKSSDFKNQSEYKYYLLSVFSAADRAEIGMEV